MNMTRFKREEGCPGLTDVEPIRMDAASLEEDIRHYYTYSLGRDRNCRLSHYAYEAVAMAVRERLMERWRNTRYAYEGNNFKRTYYLSLEFLMGRTLGNSVLNLGIEGELVKALSELCLEMEEIEDIEPDAGLGNGGLGRLAACFLDSCATLQLPVQGYGIRYEYGMFRQHIVDGYQVEEPDHWLAADNCWEIKRPEYRQRVKFGGRSEVYEDASGRRRVRWVDTNNVYAIPYDLPIPGIRTVRSIPCGCGRPSPRRNSTWVNSTPATIPVRWREKTTRKKSPWSCIPTMPAKTARNCDCASSISWLRPACRTCWTSG